jgi:hypothetical protein
MLTDAVPPEAVGPAFGFHRAMDTVGAVIGPLLAFLLFRASGTVRAYGIGLLGVRWGARRVLAAGYALFGAMAVGFIAAPPHPSLAVLLALFLLAGLSLSVEEVLEGTVAAELLPEHVRGTATARWRPSTASAISSRAPSSGCSGRTCRRRPASRTRRRRASSVPSRCCGCDDARGLAIPAGRGRGHGRRTTRCDDVGGCRRGRSRRSRQAAR